MKFDVVFERVYPHPIEKVWRFVASTEELSAWLMETDFVAEPGRAFEMWCDDGDGGTDRYRCRVLQIEPPHRMVWSWLLDGREAAGETRVEFRLTEVPGGTRLTVRHSGDRDRDTIESFKAGWPYKLELLDNELGG